MRYLAMIAALCVVLCVVLPASGCVDQTETDSSSGQSVEKGPGVIGRFFGAWACAGTYYDVPLLSFAHGSVAQLEIRLDGASGIGAYQETQEVAPVAAIDQLSLDTPASGTRLAVDSFGGHQTATFVVFSGIGDGPTRLVFRGRYETPAFMVATSETLDLAADDQRFDFVANLDGALFQTQECTRTTTSNDTGGR